MRVFDPLNEIRDCEQILDKGKWPNFHDAEVHHLNIWRGDVRPEDNVWIGPVIEMSFELCALQNPYIACLRFHDCENIELVDFNHQNAVYDLRFGFQDRGTDNNGSPLSPYIYVEFEQAFGLALSFRCMNISAFPFEELSSAPGDT